MTTTEIYEAYLNLIWSAFQYDIEVFSQTWIYLWVLVPASIYLVFFILKWFVLTAPIWLPIAIILNSTRGK